MNQFKPTATGSHEREEEIQWARIVSSGDLRKSMTLVFIQKLCTAFHEFEPAYENNAVNENSLRFFKDRLAARTRKVIEVFVVNNLAGFSGFYDLEAVLEETENAPDMKTLAGLTEKIHQLNHRLCKALEK